MSLGTATLVGCWGDMATFSELLDEYALFTLTGG